MLPENQFLSSAPPKQRTIVKKTNYHSVSIDLTQDEIDLIERAADVLGCDPKFFINDAAIWKAKGVMKRLEYEHIR